MPTVRHIDPFSATLLSSETLAVSLEQKVLIKKVLDKSSSDSRFSDKAYIAIERILTGGAVVPPVISSLNPGSATVGDPSFTLHVMGSGFTPGSIIVFNGGEEPTTYASAQNISTEVDMTTVSVASTVPVSVLNPDGVLSDAQLFVFQDAVTFAAGRKETVRNETKTKDVIVPPMDTKMSEESRERKDR